MTMTSLTSWILLALVTTVTDAFIFNAQVHPALETVSHVTPGTAFRSRLDFDYNDSQGKSHQLAINGPVFEILNDACPSTVPLPHASGANAHLSTGSRCLKILQEAFFVGMQGMEQVPFEKGCCEMAWMDDQKEGQLVCAFHLPFPVSMNHRVVHLAVYILR